MIFPDDEDPYVYPGTDVLVNKENIKDPSELETFEKLETSQAIADLLKNPVKGAEDLDHLKEVHRRILGDVYPFAGEIRTCELMKREPVLRGRGVDYSEPAMISEEAEAALKALREEKFTDLRSPGEIDALSTHVAEVWRTHPFREGNTRAALIFVDQFAKERGCELDSGVISKVPSETRDALVLAAQKKDNTRLNKIFSEAREMTLSRNHPVIGRITTEAAEVLKLLDNPEIKPAESAETVKGVVLATSYETVLLQTSGGIRSIKKDVFPTPPENNARVTISIPAKEKDQGQMSEEQKIYTAVGASIAAHISPNPETQKKIVEAVKSRIQEQRELPPLMVRGGREPVAQVEQPKKPLNKPDIER